MTTSGSDKIVYWHRDLPPLDSELMAEHVVEATSARVAGTLGHRNELWDSCYQDLMANAQTRLAQEVARFGGRYAHVLDESIDIRHDAAAGEAWLHGRFSYMLFRQAVVPVKMLATACLVLLLASLMLRAGVTGMRFDVRLHSLGRVVIG